MTHISPRLIQRTLPFLGVNGFYLAQLINKLHSESPRETISILDIGSGEGTPWKVASMFLDTSDLKIVALDGIASSESHNQITQYLAEASLDYIVGDALTVLSTYADNSFDLVVSMDVIEHLPKDRGYLLLYEMNRIAKRAFALSCPNGFKWQPPKLDNPFQAHVSGWKYREFKSMGMTKIKTYHGLQILTNPFMKKKYKLDLVTSPIYGIDVLLGKLFPWFSAAIWVHQIGKLPILEESGTTYTDQFLGKQT